MKITFIRPSMFGEKAADAMKPLAITILAGLTGEEIETEFFDDRVEQLPDRLDTDVIAMTVETFTAKRAYFLAEKYRKDKVKIIMGGFHPSMLPEESLLYADCVVIGDAEDVWPGIIEDLKNNSLQRIYRSNNSADISQVRYRGSILRGKKYNPVHMVQYNRGCKYNCDFCSIHAFYGRGVRQRDISVVIDEIKQSREKLVFFIDDNIFYNERRAHELFTALMPLKKKWICQVSLDIAENKELLALMKKSGCIAVVIGFESLNQKNLEQMGKSANLKYGNYSAMINNIYGAGIMIYGTFVFGYDWDTPETIRETVQFAIENKFAVANFNPLIPMPGTRLYDRLKAEGRLTRDNWWLDDNYRYGDALFVPKGMTAEELTEGCKNARYEFHSCVSIFRRMINYRANTRSLWAAATYVLANLISRREIYRKQGQFLGGTGEEVPNGTDRQCI